MDILNGYILLRMRFVSEMKLFLLLLRRSTRSRRRKSFRHGNVRRRDFADVLKFEYWKPNATRNLKLFAAKFLDVD